MTGVASEPDGAESLYKAPETSRTRSLSLPRRFGHQLVSRTMCVARGLKTGGPRSVRGGRSARYEERRLAHGTVVAKAPSWSDATAAAVLQVLEDASEMATGSKKLAKKKVARMLASAEGVRLLSSGDWEGA